MQDLIKDKDDESEGQHFDQHEEDVNFTKSSNNHSQPNNLKARLKQDH